MTQSTRRSPPPSSSSGISSTASGAPAAASRAQERALGLEHQRMHDGLQALEAGGIGEQRLGQLLAIDLAVGRGAGKRGLDSGTAAPS